MTAAALSITGEVQRPIQLTYDDLAAVEARFHIDDVSQIDPKRSGTAVLLDGLLEICGVKPTAKFLGLHAERDDFHASIPLAPLLGRALLIYGNGNQPLSTDQGGPFRLLIPDFAACHTDEIDECANVKFIDRLELTIEKGFDNRPRDDHEHEELHRREEKT